MELGELFVSRLFREIGVGPEALERPVDRLIRQHALRRFLCGHRLSFVMVSSSLPASQPPMPDFRVIPAIEVLMQRPAIRTAAVSHGRDRVVATLRDAAAALRETLTRDDAAHRIESEDAAARWIETRALDRLQAALAPSLRRAINATGVILHTNLGRAPIALEALARAASIASGYSTLEYDLDAGRRGHRYVHAERLLCDLTAAEAAVVVNNNAAAVLLVLAALAAGREVVVSRGELVEIGGGFRVPDILSQSGATLREVGTTNRTRASDYAAAISDRTALVLRVHPSNFRVEGFTERPELGELSALARSLRVPIVEDLGSGWLGDVADFPALRDEPSVRASLAAGADLVTFSGDKLLGGPQAGIVVGRRDLVDRLRTHPLMRALRADKLTYSVLEATLAMWLQESARPRLPVYRMLTITTDELDGRARGVAQLLATSPGLTCRIVEGHSTTGGGSAPASALPTRLLAIERAGLSAAALEERLRRGDPPVIGRIENRGVVLDLRTVLKEDEPLLVSVLLRV
jgi:L-seryl-tRNA(Ser) seleniumtransferase